MNTQISLKLSSKLMKTAKNFSEAHGFDSLQDFIREMLREKLFEEEKISGILTYKASESALAKRWLSKEENDAWKHLEKEI